MPHTTILGSWSRRDPAKRSRLVGCERTGGTVESQLIVESADNGAVEDLWQWLQQHDALRGRVRQVTEPAPEGRMGPVLTDTLMVALGSGGAGSVLAHALLVWLRRPRGVAVRLKIVDPRGGSIELDLDRATTAEAQAMLQSALSAPPTAQSADKER